MSNVKEFEAGQNLAIETASGMAQLRLACESVPGPTSTLCDQHEQTVPVISPRGNSSEGSRWLDGKCSMVSRQLDEKCVHNGQVASHQPLHAEMIGTASRGLNETTKRVERVKVGGLGPYFQNTYKFVTQVFRKYGGKNAKRSH